MNWIEPNKTTFQDNVSKNGFTEKQSLLGNTPFLGLPQHKKTKFSYLWYTIPHINKFKKKNMKIHQYCEDPSKVF